MVSKQAVLRTAVPAELREWVDNRLVSAHIRIVRSMVLGTLLNAALIVAAMIGTVPLPLLALFAVSISGAAFHRLWLSEGIARGRRQKRPEKMHAAFWLSSLWLGMTFAVPMAHWLPWLAPGQQLLLAICGVTQIASAAYTVRTLPRSAAVYIAAQAAGLAIGLVQLGTLAAFAAIAVLLVGSGLLGRMAFTAHDLFVTRILADRELAASARTVKLLLNEYEESGSDWLFEVDRAGRLTGVSRRFAAAAGRTVEQLEGLPFAALFDPCAASEALASALSERRTLRGHVVPLEGTESWWSISGRPCYLSAEDKVAFRGVIADVTSQRLAENRVHHMAHYDALTGLPNRALFNQTLADLLEGDEASGHAALLLVDVDHFKAVNDMYGHPTGDAFLRALADRMAAAVETSGLGGSHPLIARLGGDEFAIVVAGQDSCDHAVRLAELLVEASSETLFVEGHELSGAVSIGIALAPHHAVLKQQLLSNADIALYAAKNGGRGMWEMFEPGMDQALHDRHTLARDLRHAVGRGELRLYLQPLVDVESEAKTGYEALLRWQHPERGLIAPDNFIPIAEETGLIVPIGEWVIRSAIAEAARWSGTETIAINLSPVQLGSPGLLPVIVNALAETGFDPGRVEFEITESVLLHNSAANIETMNRLHALGVKVALDDFGTGYASLNYLLTFPFDKIKIDRRFISQLATSEESRAIVGAVIGLANELGMCTLAEGVEDAAQLDRLKAHGCRMVQGWLFGKAAPPEDYPALLPVIPAPTGAPAPTLLRPAARLRRKLAAAQTYSPRSGS